MIIEQLLSSKISTAVKELYSADFTPDKVVFAKTNKEFEGDITLVVFPFVKLSKKTPEATAIELGEYLQKNVSEVEKFNVVKGFLNLVISKTFWLNYFNGILPIKNFGFVPVTKNSPTIMLEYCGPNTNKPLHLGHVRNILVGWSMIKILEANGNKVIKVNIVNDRGIHICKSMLAWIIMERKSKLEGVEPETPENTANYRIKKGDHFVGHYYVEFNNAYIEQIKDFKELSNEILDIVRPILADPNKVIDWKDQFKKDTVNIIVHFQLQVWERGKSIDFQVPGQIEFLNSPKTTIDKLNEDLKNFITHYEAEIALRVSMLDFDNISDAEFIEGYNKIFTDFAPLVYNAHYLLRLWENNDKKTVELWKMMNSWVLAGFEETYKEIGVSFDKTYFESETYLFGKEVVLNNIGEGKPFKKRKDGAVVIDLTSEKLDEKVLLRTDGTTVYITQDIGTAIQRIKDYSSISKLIYTVGNEQEHHFKVLFKILEKLGYTWAKDCYHLSYGMVELPEGKMKSREGTVVDADDLIADMINEAKEAAQAAGKIEEFSKDEAEKLYHTIALGALKYFILKVDPKKKMLFNPKESIDLNGNTGPFIQYTYTRINSVLRKVGNLKLEVGSLKVEMEDKEKDIIKLLYDFPNAVKEAGANYSPAAIANYTYELAKCYNQFYHDITILKEENEQKKNFRLALSKITGKVIKNAMSLLGIEVPERM